MYQQQLEKLENISGLSVDEAKEYLLKNIEGEVKLEAAILVKDIYEKAKEESSRKAKEVLSTAIQRCAVDHSSDITVSVVALPNDEMKGRIIGREGRNIRTLETLTGIDLIIDDTPEAVILSGFDPIRREVARIALKSLLPMVEFIQLVSKRWLRKLRKRLRRQFAKRRSPFETGACGLHPELVRLLANSCLEPVTDKCFKSSKEVAHLAGLIASELEKM